MSAGFDTAYARDLVDVAVSKHGSSAVQFKVASAHAVANTAFGSHLVDWLALAVVAVFALAVWVGTRRFMFWLVTNKRRSDKSEREYWRIHGGE